MDPVVFVVFGFLNFAFGLFFGRFTKVCPREAYRDEEYIRVSALNRALDIMFIAKQRVEAKRSLKRDEYIWMHDFRDWQKLIEKEGGD